MIFLTDLGLFVGGSALAMALLVATNPLPEQLLGA
jgi:hypothetical protein